MEPTTPLTLAVLEGYLTCKYLGSLRLAGEHGKFSEYLVALDESRSLARTALTKKIAEGNGRLSQGTLLTREALLRGDELILDARLVSEEMVIEYPGLCRVNGDSPLGGFHYVPILFSAGRRPDRTERILVEVLALLLAGSQGMLPRYGIVYFGTVFKSVKIKFSDGLKRAKDLLSTIRPLQTRELQPRLIVNEHCSQCEFSVRCHEQAIREDNISLLRGIGQKAITAYARRGILRLTQLAHTFRPRRRGKRAEQKNPKRYHALQALAVRDRRV